MPASPTAAPDQPKQLSVTQNSPSASTPPPQIGDTAPKGAPESLPQVVVNIPAPPPVRKDSTADIINAFAALAWPLVIGLALILFRQDIVSLAKRIRRGKAFGAEAEFDQDLEALNREVKKAVEESEATAPGVAERQGAESRSVESPDTIQTKVLAETVRSPRLALMMLSAEIDRLARRLAAATGHRTRSTLREQLDIWGATLPPHISLAYRLFSRVRNSIVHGVDASDNEILSAIDSGLALYSALDSVPYERNTVLHTDVDIFGDAAATQLMEGKAVIIKTVYDGKEMTRIFPTTQSNLRPGMNLTWEWNMDRVWGEAWYRDPDTGEIRNAWSGSAEFVGRDLNQV